MSITQEKREDRVFRPRDPIYAGLIDDLRLKIKHREGQKPGAIRAKKVECLHRFEEFNNCRAVTKFYSLYSLCDNQHLRDQAVKRDYESGGERSCFVDQYGKISMIVLHIRKDEMREFIYYSIKKKLAIEMHFISSFKDPGLYISVCFSRKGEPDKVKITPRASGIFKKLFKVLSASVWLI